MGTATWTMALRPLLSHIVLACFIRDENFAASRGDSDRWQEIESRIETGIASPSPPVLPGGDFTCHESCTWLRGECVSVDGEANPTESHFCGSECVRGEGSRCKAKALSCEGSCKTLLDETPLCLPAHDAGHDRDAQAKFCS